MTAWHDPLSTPPPPEDRAEHTGGKLWMRGADGSLRAPTMTELETHGWQGHAPRDLEQEADEAARFRLAAHDDWDARRPW